MADPFSVIAGTAGILDVCFRVIKYLKETRAGAERIEEEITGLLREIEALIAVNDSIKCAFETELKAHPGPYVADIEDLWKNIGSNLWSCRALVERLEVYMKEIIGKEGPKVIGKRDGLRKQMRKQSKKEDFQQLRLQLASHQNALQISLSALTLLYVRRAQSKTDVSLDQLSEDVQGLGLSLKSKIASLQPVLESTYGDGLRDSIKSAAAIASLVSSNKHFHLPQAVSSIFTGREALLENLKDLFSTSSFPKNSRTQKRFIIHGLGGSGKTQFCCKFAQDNRENFWGIFWIDASSDKSAKHTLSRIAKIAGVEPNERAAKSWLSSLEYPWLLLIDSADDSKISIDEYFPEGERGHILVTTRNPAHRVHGTVGSGSWKFERMETNDASDLLLKAAGEPSPWSLSTKKAASDIANTLGYLPLALVHAGRAIMNELCTLESYLSFYERSWQQIRRARDFSGHGGDDTNMNVYSSYEIIYQGLETAERTAAKDAVELLKTFAFLHSENIRVDFLTKAAINPRLEQEQREKEETIERKMSGASRRKTWKQILKDMGAMVMVSIYKNRGPPVLPAMIRDVEALGSVDEDSLKDRLRLALKELTQMSLVTHHPRNDSYSIHPLVHTWARKRPQMHTADQAVWCQVAATILTQCILLPPLGDTELDVDIRRDLVSHVDHVQKCQEEIKSIIAKNQKSRRRLWPVYVPGFDRGQALQYAKFSLVYSQCGRFDEAEKLQLVVKDFVCSMLGMEHPAAIAISLALSGTYWSQTRGNEAAELQDQVLQACLSSFGESHSKTLKVMDTLGTSRCYQGRFKDALPLHEKAIEGMTKTLGADHHDTLIAIDNLGRVLHRYFRCDEAKELHTKAVERMKRVLGPTHLDTLVATDNLAMTYLELGGDFIVTAHELMIHVVEQRKKKLGKENPYTLWSVCNLARIKNALGYSDEAESIMRAALPIAERNLGENHLGPLAGKAHLAQVLVSQKRYSEAEAILLDVIQRHRYQNGAQDGEHLDRIIAMWYLLLCYQKQDRLEDAIRMCDEVSEGLNTLGAQRHPFYQRILDKRKELVGLKTTTIASTAKPISV
ncbi:hypothetical protein MMC07_000694 [Pseudocyphellaria aurata]|nr:hypothetical protein [Pseudocyphellaria aurata]